MRTFYELLANVLIAGTTNNFIWFALTFWVYLETKSVVSTAFVGGIYLVVTALSGFWFGSIVDHNKKKHAMLLASFASLFFYSLGFLIYQLTPVEAFTSVLSPVLWFFSLILLFGVISGNIFNIAVPTLITILVPENIRDKANGMFGTVTGIGFGLTSIASGLILAYGGMYWVLITAMVFTFLATVHLWFIPIKEEGITQTTTLKHPTSEDKKIDIKGTVALINSIPGLFPLIFFTTFNNFLGGVFMALMDAYGLSLLSVQVWGTLLGILSFGFIIGGFFIAKKGLGKNPLKTLFDVNIIMWIVCIFFTIQPSILLLGIGMLIWMALVPFIEATEQTIIQKVVPLERQGRVFGFAQSIEQAASPLTAFLIGPIAQFFFIPFMSEGGLGARLIGGWFGVGEGRGIALVFITTGIAGLIVTIFSIKSKAYKLLTARYLGKGE